MSDLITSTSSLPSVCNYMPKRGIIEEEMVLFNQTDLIFSSEAEEIASPKRSQPVIDKTTFEIREEELAAMKATLLKAISNVCIHMIQHHREQLKKQYKIAAEEMEAIQKKHA